MYYTQIMTCSLTTKRINVYNIKLIKLQDKKLLNLTLTTLIGGRIKVSII